MSRGELGLLLRSRAGSSLEFLLKYFLEQLVKGCPELQLGALWLSTVRAFLEI